MRRINVAATEQRYEKHSMPREFDRFGNFVHDDSNASCCPKISRWCVKDTEGIIFAVLTWILLLYGYFVLIIFVLIPENYSWSRVIINWIILNSLTILAFLSHIRAMFINPVGSRKCSSNPTYLDLSHIFSLSSSIDSGHCSIEYSVCRDSARAGNEWIHSTLSDMSESETASNISLQVLSECLSIKLILIDNEQEYFISTFDAFPLSASHLLTTTTMS